MTKQVRNKRRAYLPRTLQAAGTTIIIRNQKIPHQEILRHFNSGIDPPTDLVEIYRQKVLTQKTRTIRLLGRKSSAKIIHTLLGYEVQASYKRVHCPDLVTARYLRLFSEIGCRSIRLPYDPTITAQLIPELETAIETITARIQELFPRNLNLQQYVIRKIYQIIRQRLRALRVEEEPSSGPEM